MSGTTDEQVRRIEAGTEAEAKADNERAAKGCLGILVALVALPVVGWIVWAGFISPPPIPGERVEIEAGGWWWASRDVYDEWKVADRAGDTETLTNIVITGLGNRVTRPLPGLLRDSQFESGGRLYQVRLDSPNLGRRIVYTRQRWLSVIED